MKTLKNEEVYPWDYQTVEDVKERITHFREQGYNQKLLNQFLLAGRQEPRDSFRKIAAVTSQPVETHGVSLLRRSSFGYEGWATVAPLRTQDPISLCRFYSTKFGIELSHAVTKMLEHAEGERGVLLYSPEQGLLVHREDSDRAEGADRRGAYLILE